MRTPKLPNLFEACMSEVRASRKDLLSCEQQELAEREYQHRYHLEHPDDDAFAEDTDAAERKELDAFFEERFKGNGCWNN